MSHPEALHEQQEWLRVTLSSIGDAVITTDTAGCVTFLNPVAQLLTGWTHAEAAGIPLETVFRIINEETRQTVENPATKALREGLVVGLANHTLLIAKDGTERPIDDSAAPIRKVNGEIAGVVLVFRDISERRRRENELRDSQERFRLVVEGVKDYAIFMLDPHGFIASWNAGAQQIKGYQAQEIIGRHFSLFYLPEAVATGFPSSELKVAAAQGRFEDEGWRVRKGGTKFWANVVITAVRDEAGNLKGFSKITRDLTERKAWEDALRSREERFRTLTETANDAIITADDRGDIVSWNNAATTIFGYESDEVLGKPLTLLMPARFQEPHRQGLERLRSTGQSRLLGKSVELQGRRKDGTEFPLELSLAGWSTEQGRFFTGIIRNIAERKQQEQAQRRAEVLADLNRRKDEFLAMLSHELRNPLSPILMAVHLLRLQKNEDPVHQQATGIIERQVGNLTRLVDDLLEVARITTGRIVLQLEHIDLRAAAQRAAETVRPLIAQRKHNLLISLAPDPVWLHADLGRLEQVVVNLLTNAAKYTDEGGQIQLTVQQDRDEALLRVADTGLGIAPDLLPNIFDMFTQAERSLDRSQGGLGVGLTIVKRVVEMHSGKVQVFSAGLGLGSEFIVRLPIVPPPTGQPQPSSNPAAVQAPPALRVLVVDDNKDAADSTAAILRQSGHDVRVAYSGPAGIEEALAYQPKAVLLDIGLPEMDGYEVARRLRQNPQFAGLSLIAVTGYGQDVDRQRSFEAGFDAHVVKPVDPRKLQALVIKLTGPRPS